MWLVNRNDYYKDSTIIRKSRIQNRDKVVIRNKTNLYNFKIADRIYGNSPISIIPPLSNSDGCFHYISSDSSIATINGDQLTINGVGSCTIIAIQEETKKYAAASISTNFKVNHKINTIIIYGERNSGTNFLQQLIPNNLLDVKVVERDWKHGFPHLDLFDLTNTCFVFVIRDVKCWIKSMYYNPYHYKVNQSLEDFIEKPLILNEDDIMNQDHREHQSILEIRYEKIKNYIEILKTKKVNGIIVNLEDLQTDGGEYFLGFISDKFYMTRKEKFYPIAKHTKTGESCYNRQYQIILPDISNKINQILEDFVTSLKNRNYYYNKLQ